MSALVFSSESPQYLTQVLPLLSKATDFLCISALIINFLKYLRFISTCEVQNTLLGTPLKMASGTKSARLKI